MTVLEANGELDAGEVWATRSFRMRELGKSSLYRHEVRHAAIEALVEAIGRILAGEYRAAGARYRASCRDRPASPADDPGRPRDRLGLGLHRPVLARSAPAKATPAYWTRSTAGSFISSGHTPSGSCEGGRATHRHATARSVARPFDGAVWITHLKRRDTPRCEYFKLPATRALALAGVEPQVPEIAVAIDEPPAADHTYREIAYEEHGGRRLLAL